jgi:hypothetical protein
MHTFRQRTYNTLMRMLNALSQSDRDNCEIVLLCANQFRLFQVTESLAGKEVYVSAVTMYLIQLHYLLLMCYQPLRTAAISRSPVALVWTALCLTPSNRRGT